jgi:hypothetical protein
LSGVRAKPITFSFDTKATVALTMAEPKFPLAAVMAIFIAEFLIC